MSIDDVATELLAILRDPGWPDPVVAIERWSQYRAVGSDPDASVAIISELLVKRFARDTVDDSGRRVYARALSSLAGLNACLLAPPSAALCELIQCIVQAPGLSFATALASACGSKDAIADGGAAKFARRGNDLWQRYVALLPGGQVTGHCAAAQMRASQHGRQSAALWLADSRSTTAYLLRQVLRRVQDAPLDNAEAGATALYLTRLCSLHGMDTFLVLLVDSLDRYVDAARIVWSLLATTDIKRFFPHLLVTFSGIEDRQRHDQAVRTFLGPSSDCREMISLILSSKMAIRTRTRHCIFAHLLKDNTHARWATRVATAFWANRAFVRVTSVARQEVAAENIVLLAGLAPDDVLFELVQDRSLLDGVTSRLDATTKELRDMAMALVDTLMEVAAKLGAKCSRIFGETCSDLVRLEHYSNVFRDARSHDFATMSPVALPHADSVSDEHATLETSQAQSNHSPLSLSRTIDSDDEDSEEDATMVDRDRPKAPLFIRDVIAMLARHESYDHVRIGLEHLPSLIVAKTDRCNFVRGGPPNMPSLVKAGGTELSDWSLKLIEALVGLRDNFHMSRFEEKRQLALAAVLGSSPESIGPYLTSTCFAGDLSLSQRLGILAVITEVARRQNRRASSTPELQANRLIRALPSSTAQHFSNAASPQSPASSVTTSAHPCGELSPTAIEKYVLMPLLVAYAEYCRQPGSAARDPEGFYGASLLAHVTVAISTAYDAASVSASLESARCVCNFLRAATQPRATDRQVLAAQLSCLHTFLSQSPPRVLLLELGAEVEELASWCVSHILPQVANAGHGAEAVLGKCLSEFQRLEETRRNILLEEGSPRLRLGRGRSGLAGLQ